MQINRERKVREEKVKTSTAVIIRQIYCGQHGQLKSALQLLFHYFNFRRMGIKDLSEKLFPLVFDEMQNLKMIGDYLKSDCCQAEELCFENRIGLCHERDYNDNPEKMLIDDIVLNSIMIKEYEEAEKKISQKTGKELVGKIIDREKEHEKILKEMLLTLTKNRTFTWDKLTVQ